MYKETSSRPIKGTNFLIVKALIFFYLFTKHQVQSVKIFLSLSETCINFQGFLITVVSSP